MSSDTRDTRTKGDHLTRGETHGARAAEGEDTRKDWDLVQEDAGKSRTDRLRVPGGSLLRTTWYHAGGAPGATAMVFVPGVWD